MFILAGSIGCFYWYVCSIG
jgi:hypothetical protein